MYLSRLWVVFLVDSKQSLLLGEWSNFFGELLSIQYGVTLNKVVHLKTHIANGDQVILMSQLRV